MNGVIIPSSGLHLRLQCLIDFFYLCFWLELLVYIYKGPVCDCLFYSKVNDRIIGEFQTILYNFESIFLVSWWLLISIWLSSPPLSDYWCFEELKKLRHVFFIVDNQKKLVFVFVPWDPISVTTRYWCQESVSAPVLFSIDHFVLHIWGYHFLYCTGGFVAFAV